MGNLTIKAKSQPNAPNTKILIAIPGVVFAFLKNHTNKSVGIASKSSTNSKPYMKQFCPQYFKKIAAN
jgi:hypothetical protein